MTCIGSVFISGLLIQHRLRLCLPLQHSEHGEQNEHYTDCSQDIVLLLLGRVNMRSDVVIPHMLPFYLPHALLIDPAGLLLVTQPILLYILIHAAIDLGLRFTLVTSLGMPH